LFCFFLASQLFWCLSTYALIFLWFSNIEYLLGFLYICLKLKLLFSGFAESWQSWQNYWWTIWGACSQL